MLAPSVVRLCVRRAFLIPKRTSELLQVVRFAMASNKEAEIDVERRGSAGSATSWVVTADGLKKESPNSFPGNEAPAMPDPASTRVSMLEQLGNKHFGRSSAEGIADLLSEWDADKDGALTPEDIVAGARKMVKEEMKSTNLKRMLIMSILTGFVSCVAIFFITKYSSKAVKESHIEKGVLVDLEGKAVSTSEVESVGSLFDMPKLDLTTLSKARELSVKYKNGQQAYFKALGALKSGSSVVRFFTSVGGVLIDGRSQTAIGTANGESHVVEAKQATRRLVADETRLYTPKEFFTQTNGFLSDGSRRLQITAALRGFVSFALSVMHFVLEHVPSFNNMVGQPFETNLVLEGELIEEVESITHAEKITVLVHSPSVLDEIAANVTKVIYDTKGTRIVAQRKKYVWEFQGSETEELSCKRLDGAVFTGAIEDLDLDAPISEDAIIRISDDKYKIQVKSVTYNQPMEELALKGLTLFSQYHCEGEVPLFTDGVLQRLPCPSECSSNDAQIRRLANQTMSARSRRLGGNTGCVEGGAATSDEYTHLAEIENEGWQQCLAAYNMSGCGDLNYGAWTLQCASPPLRGGQCCMQR